MLQLFYKIFSYFLLKNDPEEAHVKALKYLGILGFLPFPHHSSSNKSHLIGLDFPSKLGVAAGFDKNAEAIDGLFKLGFGFVEIGTVTPKPQNGNEMPRLFRLQEDMAVINRMGFNNDGAEIVSSRLKKRSDKGKKGIVGVNIGANKDSQDRIQDYALCASYFTDVASYITINVSSPNTENLRDLQSGVSLTPLIEGVVNKIEQSGKNIPIFIKIAPDLMHEDLEDIADVVNHSPVAGIITTNTTTQRLHTLKSEHAHETGGLSGKPLFDLSTAVTEIMRSVLEEDKIIIGCGGIDSGETAEHKLRTGANLIQIYSGLIYKGIPLISEILRQIKKMEATTGIEPV